MRIRILTSRDGHPCGAEVDVPDAIAETWIAVGDAERVVPVVSVAAQAPVETAMKPKGKGR